MIRTAGLKKTDHALLLFALLMISGCGMASSYRPADQTTIRDITDRGDYRKTVGVMSLANTTVFADPQVAEPFMSAFISGLEAAASGALLQVPGKAAVPRFLWNPPRTAGGELDVFTLSAMARQAGMNLVVSPILMDMRVRNVDTGFWFSKEVTYRLQIQTAAAIYDTITGARLALELLIDEVEIDKDQATVIRQGREVPVDDLVAVAEEMGAELGRQMGAAAQESKWLTTVVAIEDGTGVITAGSEVGVKEGDRFIVIDGSGMLTGLDGQRYVVPGPQIGDITIRRTTPRQSFGTPESGEMPPAGSILIPQP